MNTQRLRLVTYESSNARRLPEPHLRDMRPLGQILVDMQSISENDLRHALHQQRRLDAPLGDILMSDGVLSARDLQSALADQHGLRIVDLVLDPPDPVCAPQLPAELCVRHGAIPWLQLDDALLVATARPDRFDDLLRDAPKGDLTLLPVLAEDYQIHDAMRMAYGPELATRAEQRVEDSKSCRHWGNQKTSRVNASGAALVASLALVLLMPVFFSTVVIGFACLTLFLSLALKLGAAAAQLNAERDADPPATLEVMRLPKVSVMVPLLREREIAGALIQRLERLTYPKAQLDIVLVLEEDDFVTRATLAHTYLPSWMRVIEVPRGTGLMTKPRALNYALDFCHGSIIGIWDAEDAPAADQIEVVVNAFHAAAQDVVCLQGRLDYYNPKANWIARCFTIEYAAWWRLIMPGLARLGFVVPLGGTTLFFRRKPLEALGAWDAHNVTEDADLGLRLARAGYRTELIDTTTYEEANCRAWPWIKQRSRWLKGYAVTWLVHMRNPRALLRDLGWYRFLGLQVFFITALSQFMLVPVFWSFWVLSLGQDHPASEWSTASIMLGFFLVAECVNWALHAIAVRKIEHRHLLRWTPTMIVYFPLGCAAMYKAMYELVVNPFYWDKTEHGINSKRSQKPKLRLQPVFRSVRCAEKT